MTGCVRANGGKRRAKNRLEERERRMGMGDEVLIAVKSGGMPNPRPCPKG